MADGMINEADEFFLAHIKSEINVFFRGRRDDLYDQRIDFFEELETFARVEKEAWKEDLANFLEESGL